MIIPGFGIVSHVMATFSGKPVFGPGGQYTIILILILIRLIESSYREALNLGTG